MKDGYKYQEGKVIITDYSSDNIRTEETRVYHDNIDEILINENIIEELNNIKNNLIQNIESNEDEIIEGKAMVFVAIFIFILCNVLIGGGFSIIFNNYIIGYLISLIFFSIVIGKPLIYDVIKTIVEMKKEINGAKLTLKVIEEKLHEIEKEKNRLKNDIKRDKEEQIKKTNSYRQLNYVDKLKEIRDYLTLWTFYGMYQQELIKYQEQNVLEEKLQNQLTETEIKVLKRIMTTKASS